MTNPKTRCLVLIDGEHYPPVIEAAVQEVAERYDSDVVGLVLVGGKEKLPRESLTELADLKIIAADDPRDALQKGLDDLEVDVVHDLSDEPVLDYRKRHQLASISLANGVPYRGAGFLFEPPPRPRVADRPSLAIVGTGKRTGKTAIAGFAARSLVEDGAQPVIVSMGRGGPPEPEVLQGDQIELTPQDLLALADSGKHAASDYVEDALLGRVATIGCRRCGGGPSGFVEHTNFSAGVELAADLPGDLLLFEGSGSAMPPVHADATGLVVPASIPAEYLEGYFGLYRLLLADFVVVTMCEEPFGSPSQVSELLSRIRNSWRASGSGGSGGQTEVVRTVFRPTPTRSVEGAEVVVATTAPEAAGEAIRRHLEDQGCVVLGISHSLADRGKLEQELGQAISSGASKASRKGADILLCEIKAAGIDTATRWGLDQGLDVVYMDNVPHGVDGDDPTQAVLSAANLARERFEENHG